MKNFFSFFIPICLIFAVGFISCSSTMPSVSDLSYSVVFDYADEKSAPFVTMSVFARSDGGVQRIDKVKIYNHSTDYKWETKNIEVLTAKNRDRAGCSVFVPPSGERFPTGLYDFTFVNKDGESATGSFVVNCPDIFYEVCAEDFDAKVSISRKKELALYDKNDVLVYYGSGETSWFNEQNELIESEVVKNYGDAFYYRNCYSINGGAQLCMLPKIYFTIKE